jgi:NAD(P)-dependent dehydrogenase (short-subunit alcohol dehydrogenase family)
MKDLKLSTKIIVITGGAGLIGKKFAEALAIEGAKVIITDVRLEVAQKIARELNDFVGRDCGYALKMDITSKESIITAIKFIESEVGGIDALVNNAYPRNKNYGRCFEDVEYSDFCENVSLHLGGYFLASQQFAIYFNKKGKGHIVNISSIYGVVPPRFEVYDDLEMTTPVEYAAIKSALIHLNKYMLKYYHGRGIRFNCISPGGIANNQPNEFLSKYNSFGNSKGMLDPSDLSGTLVFLLSDDSKYINGQNIIVDDGWGT